MDKAGKIKNQFGKVRAWNAKTMRKI